MTSIAPFLSVRRGSEALAFYKAAFAAEELGWRVGRVVDPYGHHWEIGHPLSA